MVVAEALACGTPVIVSSATGARELLVKNPACGWVVDPDLESIYECITQRIKNPVSLEAARGAATVAASSFSWEAYRAKVGGIIGEWYA
jgi:glycosyltransferase involved in cell wall biosynthesis